MSEGLLTLSPHPDTPPGPVARLRARAVREGGVLAVRFVLEGVLDQIALPPPTAPGRADELWKHTCFEAFVRAPGAAAYREFNLAPSGRWQAYDFTAYRERAPDPVVAPPAISVSGALELIARLEAGPDGPWQAALTAVIETRAGARSYWSLRHAPGAPDFHHPDGFVLELPAP